MQKPLWIFGESTHAVVDAQLDAAHQGVRLHLLVGHLACLVHPPVPDLAFPLTDAGSLHVALPPPLLLLVTKVVSSVLHHHLLLLSPALRRRVSHLEGEAS